ncbi:MAG: hypothetical protein ANABAC_3376 [Anaerolineae bacterium]|nr:MAG: hypothetical protein ANABAC_3376 [Anaerolineae bacterium]
MPSLITRLFLRKGNLSARMPANGEFIALSDKARRSMDTAGLVTDMAG